MEDKKYTWETLARHIEGRPHLQRLLSNRKGVVTKK
jgi:hypothetical protein